MQLNWACYNDAPLDDVLNLTDATHITGYTTGPNHYLRVFAPSATDEVGVSQRHTGRAGTGFRVTPTEASPSPTFHIINTDVPHARFEGIELDGSNVSNGAEVGGLFIQGAGIVETRVDGLIVHGLSNSTGTNRPVKGIAAHNGDVLVSNTTIYALTNTLGGGTTAKAMGVELNNCAAAYYLHNNTIFDIKQTNAGGDEALGIVDWCGVSTVRNTYIGDVTSIGVSPKCFHLVGTQSHNVSSDNTASGANSQTLQTNYSDYFIDVTPGSEDFHLRNDSNSLWGTYGLDLDTDPNLPVTEDFDGQPRSATLPHVGADEAFACAPLSVTQGAGVITVTRAEPVRNGVQRRERRSPGCFLRLGGRPGAIERPCGRNRGRKSASPLHRRGPSRRYELSELRRRARRPRDTPRGDAHASACSRAVSRDG